jgi:hypothetical protein
MKKIFLFTIILLFLSCKKETTQANTTLTNNKNTLIVFHPPSWIIGTWSLENNSLSFNFSDNNIEQTTTGGVTSDFTTIWTNANAKLSNETSSNTTYNFKETLTGMTYSYYFVKTSENTLLYYSKSPSIAGSIGAKMVRQ